MSQFRVEWQMGGEITIDTEGTDWTPEEVETQVWQVLMSASEEPADRVGDEFDDCDVVGEDVNPQIKIQRLS